MKFKKECGVVVSSTNKALCYVEGEAGHVDFPEELIWEMHKASPGSIYKITHSHPDDMPNPSTRDLAMLKTWAFAMYPFPIRLSVVSKERDGHSVHEKVFFAQVEPRNDWLARGKGTRICQITEEFATVIGISEHWIPWEEWIIENTYST